LPAKRCSLAHVDVDGEDDGIRRVDDLRVERLVARRALRLDDEVDAVLAALRGQRVGGHEGVRDAGRAGRDGDDARRAAVDQVRAVRRCGAGGAAAGAGAGDGRGHEATTSSGSRRRAARGEVLAHEAARELRQHGQVLLGRRVGRGDEEDEVGRAVVGAEVDTGLQPREGERRLAHRRRSSRAGSRCRPEGRSRRSARASRRRRRGLRHRRPSRRRHARGEGVDDGPLVGAERLVEADERRRDDL
jgi:hypothetical protein